MVVVVVVVVLAARDPGGRSPSRGSQRETGAAAARYRCRTDTSLCSFVRRRGWGGGGGEGTVKEERLVEGARCQGIDHRSL